MAQVRYTRQARADLIDIWLYIAADNQAAADRCLDDLEARCSRLATFPELGPERPDIAPGARMLVIDDGWRCIGSRIAACKSFASLTVHAT